MRVEETGNFFVVPAEGGGGEGGNLRGEDTSKVQSLNFKLHLKNLGGLVKEFYIRPWQCPVALPPELDSRNINVQPWQCPVLHEIQSLPSVALPPELDSSKQ